LRSLAGVLRDGSRAFSDRYSQPDTCRGAIGAAVITCRRAVTASPLPRKLPAGWFPVPDSFSRIMFRLFHQVLNIQNWGSGRQNERSVTGSQSARRFSIFRQHIIHDRPAADFRTTGSGMGTIFGVFIEAAPELCAWPGVPICDGPERLCWRI